MNLGDQSMTSIFSSLEFDMDLSHLDDKMELGTSPYPLMDEIDFEFEANRQQSVDRSMADDADTTINSTDPMQADTNNEYDDDMLDEDTIQQPYDDDLEDLNMESYGTENVDQQDDEILYDNEEEGATQIDEQEAEQEVASFIPDDQEISSVENTQERGGGESIQDINKTTNQVNEPQESGVNSVDVLDFATQKQTSNSRTDFAKEDNVFDTLNSDNDSKQPHLTQEKINGHDQQVSADSTITATAQTPSRTEPEALEITITTAADEENHRESETYDALHPVTIIYLGQEMSFFPPMLEDPSATFFLQDVNLAYEPVEKLLASCRDILGETLEHDDELVLDVPALGLHICEDSKYASQITLSQIVNVFLQLSRNENIADIEPLYCNLSSRVCLASQYAYLTGSATEGKTFSEIAADYVDTPANDANSFREVSHEHDEQQLDHDPATPKDDNNNIDTPSLAQPNESILGDHDGDANATTSASDYDTTGNVVQNSTEPSSTVEITAGTHVETEPDAEDPPVTVPNVASHEASFQLDVQEILKQPKQDTDNVIGAEEESKSSNENVETTYFNDNASGSSHTMEGEDGTDPVEQVTLEMEQPSEHHQDQQIEDHQQYNEENEVAEIGEDLFGPDDVLSEHGNDSDTDVPTEEPLTIPANEELPAQDLASANEHIEHVEPKLSEVETEPVSDHDELEDSEEIDLLEVDDASGKLPVTPSKQNANKRKTLAEEDDLEFLDFSTPEPKRTRPS